MMSTLRRGSRGWKLFSSWQGIRRILLNSPPISCFPLRPDMMLLSRYTGYIGSVIAMMLPLPNRSVKLPVSDLAPSDMKISSKIEPHARGANSPSNMACRRNSYPVRDHSPGRSGVAHLVERGVHGAMTLRGRDGSRRRCQPHDISIGCRLILGDLAAYAENR
jgi:hypothetical protein